jgi:hypothetical protein
MGLAVRIIALVGPLLLLLANEESLSSFASEWRTAQLQSSPSTQPVAPSESLPAPSPKTGTPATVIDDQDVDGILGKNVRGSAGEDMGRIVDILVNRTGNVRAAIIDFGGFLGVGSRKIAVDWAALRFPESGKLDRIAIVLTRNQVRLAPEYKPGEPIVVLGSSDGVMSLPENTSPKSEK